MQFQSSTGEKQLFTVYVAGQSASTPCFSKMKKKEKVDIKLLLFSVSSLEYFVLQSCKSPICQTQNTATLISYNSDSGIYKLVKG